MRIATQNNRIEFLIDEEFFSKVHVNLTLIERAPVADNTYVLIGLWAAELETIFPQCLSGEQPARTFQTVLQALEDAGHEVRIVLWAGSSVSGVTGAKERTKALAIQRWARDKDHVKVYLEPYNSSFAGISAFSIGSSMHQKIVICSYAGDLRAVVGGFNFGTEYSSRLDHSLKGQYWHDTAVCIEGPAAAVVHNEWCRRWSKQGDVPGTIGLMDPATYPDAGKSKSAITIATTNTEVRTYSQKLLGLASFGYWSGRENHIREVMIERIQAAEKSIYIEGYAFTDPALVTALQEKLRTTEIPIVVLINHPQNELFEANTTWSYYHYYVFVQLAVARATKIVVKNSSGETRTLTAGNPEFEEDRVKILMPESDGGFFWMDHEGYLWRAHMTNIQSIEGPPIMYGARTNNTRTNRAGKTFRCWPYPHSKLAIFDDTHLVVGSANWTYRSMEYDGEISALITDDAKVPLARSRLLGHWLTKGDTIKDWVKQSGENDAVRNDALNKTRDGLHIMRLRYDDFLHPDVAATKKGSVPLVSLKTSLDAIWKMF